MPWTQERRQESQSQGYLANIKGDRTKVLMSEWPVCTCGLAMMGRCGWAWKCVPLTSDLGKMTLTSGFFVDVPYPTYWCPIIQKSIPVFHYSKYTVFRQINVPSVETARTLKPVQFQCTLSTELLGTLASPPESLIEKYQVSVKLQSAKSKSQGCIYSDRHYISAECEGTL